MKRKRAGNTGDGELYLGLIPESPGATAQNPISVGGLTDTIRDLLEANLSEVWVTGEISNYRSPGSGHLYFTLKDETATLQAVMFRPEARRIGFALEDGMAVLARGSVTVYEARGQYQLQVVEVRTRGQGSLQQRFEALKRKLQAEHLFDLDRKRPLPVFPEVIGVVTSLQGAVLRDMLQILQRRGPGIRIKVRGVRVQGPGAAEEIAEAIGAFGVEGNVDLLVVARGGGSLEDLWAFNEEPVARALAACGMPTISAVGHETDFTIADFVADVRAPTPSAAAELLTRDWNEWRESVGKLKARLGHSTRQALARRRRQVEHLASSYALREPQRIVRQWAQRLDDLRENLYARTLNTVQARRHQVRLMEARLAAHHPARELGRRRQHLAQLSARLRALGPQATLDRGYALVLDAAGRPVFQAAKSLEGKPVEIVLSDGTAGANLTKVQPKRTLLEALRAKAKKSAPPEKNRKKGKRKDKQA
ncbi:MAG TPA: exodeoxyribonuclease VII large subunit [Candidatus Methylacidiphilales bacterium]|nr:exodeoxyribonuclease VII large subunit [Candidatus Methylacidiphilales bacterium]